MYKSICRLTFLFVLSTPSFAQVTDPAGDMVYDREYYLKKSRAQRTAGWILAGTGTVLIASGVVVAFADVLETAFTGDRYDKTGEIMIIGGVACGAGSIPLFIAGGKNKKRAQLAISTQTIPIGFRPGQQISYPSIGMVINIR